MVSYNPVVDSIPLGSGGYHLNDWEGCAALAAGLQGHAEILESANITPGGDSTKLDKPRELNSSAKLGPTIIRIISF